MPFVLGVLYKTPEVRAKCAGLVRCAWGWDGARDHVQRCVASPRFFPPHGPQALQRVKPVPESNGFVTFVRISLDFPRVNVYKDKVKNAGGLPALPQQAALHDALAGTYAELRCAAAAPDSYFPHLC